MHIRTDFWRYTLFTALGLASQACSTSAEPVNGETPRDKDKRSGDGLLGRPTNKVTCESELPREKNAGQAERGEGQCNSDAECTDESHGYCANVAEQPAPPDYKCKYGCVSDADCESDQVCRCGSPVGTCVASDCSENADCGSSSLCAEAYTKASCSGSYSYRCLQEDDECAVHDDCPNKVCHFDGTRRVCSEPGPPCGRPFLVEGAARMASLSAKSFGADEVALPGAARLDAATRETLGQYWAQIGLMEHASIAAFARFTLQLMQLEAPIELLEASQRAMLDETEHAKACFGIASALLGRSVGAGKIPMDNALMETSLEDVVRLTVREGCIGETIAAIDAAEAAATTQEPHIRSVLERVRADEFRHAELAWRFLQWALSVDASRPIVATRRLLRDVVREEIAAALAEPEPASTTIVSEVERAHLAYGVLPGATRAAVRRAALEGVVAPCAAELLRCFDTASHPRDVVARV